MNFKSIWVKAAAGLLLSLVTGSVLAVAPAGRTITNTVNLTYSDTVGINTYMDTDTVDITINQVYSVAWGASPADQEIQSGSTSAANTTTISNLGNGTINRVFVGHTSSAETGDGTTLNTQTYDFTATDGNFTGISATAGNDNGFSLFGGVASGTQTGTCVTSCTVPLYFEGFADGDVSDGVTTVTIAGETCVASWADTVGPMTLTGCSAEPTIADGTPLGEYITLSFTVVPELDEDEPNDFQEHDFVVNVFADDCGIPCGNPAELEETQASTDLVTTRVLGPVMRVYKYVRNVTTAGNNPTVTGDCTDGADPECVFYNTNRYFDSGVVADQDDVLEYLLVSINTADTTYYSAASVAASKVLLTTSCNTSGTGELDDCDLAAASTVPVDDAFVVAMGTAEGTVIDDDIPPFTTMHNAVASTDVSVDITCNGTAVAAEDYTGDGGVVRIDAAGTGVAGDTLYFYLGAGADDTNNTGAQSSGGQLAVDQFVCALFQTEVD